MASPTYTFTLTNGQTADASQVTQNFNDILNGVTDGTKDLSFAALTCSGTAILNGHVNIGNSSSDDFIMLSSLASSIPIKTTALYDIGSATLGLAGIYLGGTVSFTTRIITAATATYTLTLPPVVPAGNDYVMRFSTAGVGTFGHPGPTGAAGADSATVLTLSSARIQVIVPTATRNYTLPTTGVKIGDIWTFVNNAAAASGFNINVLSSGSNQIIGVYPGTIRQVVALQDTPTTSAHWGPVGRKSSDYYKVQTRTAAASLSLATVTASNLTATPLTLTPGTWDISATNNFLITGGAASNIQLGFTQVSADFGGLDIGVDYWATTVSGSGNYSVPVPLYRVTVTVGTTQTWYASIFQNSGSNATVTGRLSARLIEE